MITWYGENTAQKMKFSIKDFFSRCAVKGSKAWPYVNHNYIKNAKKRVCIAKGEGSYIHGVIFIYVRCSISKFIRKKSSWSGKKSYDKLRESNIKAVVEEHVSSDNIYIFWYCFW